MTNFQSFFSQNIKNCDKSLRGATDVLTQRDSCNKNKLFRCSSEKAVEFRIKRLIVMTLYPNKTDVLFLLFGLALSAPAFPDISVDAPAVGGLSTR